MKRNKKIFISRCPKLASNTHDSHTIRNWYYKFHGHAKQYCIYVHNYFDFYKLSGNPKGFTCGGDIDSASMTSLAYLNVNSTNGIPHPCSSSRHLLFPWNKQKLHHPVSVPTLDIQLLRAISKLWYPNSSFDTESLPSNLLKFTIDVIRSSATTTSKEQALG